MNYRKYRICLLLLIVVVLAGGIYYVYSQSSVKEPQEGILVMREKPESGEMV